MIFQLLNKYKRTLSVALALLFLLNPVLPSFLVIVRAEDIETSQEEVYIEDTDTDEKEIKLVDCEEVPDSPECQNELSVV
ncbi:MAG: hypothetical protein Q9M91_02995 [Candidatus Dojkabacteria bacterium]|nr:hypothetical protein [Candidatus Dojkabacteria bacterium]MDQ7020791.1 hypothetical protein [Candidatus Dojkabacteria bacterium]